MKTCSTCKIQKPYSEFYKDNTKLISGKIRGDGYQNRCKPCALISVMAAPSSKNKKWPKRKRTKEENLAAYRKDKLRYNFSRGMRKSLHSNKNGASWESLVGYTLVDLKTHIEKQFVEGMSWDNYGPVWHIDHIRPVASFNIKTAECSDFKECWSLNNLQPLFALDNFKKGSTYKDVRH